jgi:RNA recognition motif-containing protein
MNIYVSNLDCQLTEGSLKEAFQAYGEVTSVRILTDRDTAHPKGFGLVEMPDKDEALKAIEALNGTELGGRTIIVNESRSETAQNSHHGKSGIKEIQRADEPTSSQSDYFPSFTDIRIRGALADAAESPSVGEVHKQVEKLGEKKPNIPWLKIIKIASVAIGIPTMFGVLAFTILNYLYPQKVKDFLARSKLFPRRPAVVSSRHLPRSEVNAERLALERDKERKQ